MINLVKLICLFLLQAHNPHYHLLHTVMQVKHMGVPAREMSLSYEYMTYAELISIVLELPQEYQKVFMIIVECLRQEQDRVFKHILPLQLTASSIALGGIVFRHDFVAAESGSQITDSASIIRSRGNKNGLDPSVFTFRENH